MDYSWSIAIIAGVITQLVVIFIGDFYFNLPVAIGPMILGILVSVVLALVYQFFVFAVDYTRTEYLQYRGRLLLLCEGGAEDHRLPAGCEGTPDLFEKIFQTRKSN